MAPTTKTTGTTTGTTTSTARKWFAAGLALATVIGGGGAVEHAGATSSSGERMVFTAIAPCRLFDTRTAPDTVGPRTAALGAGETFTVQARGPQGKCNLPADASAISMNVAAIGGTASSFLTVFPADVTLPLAANLNWVANQPPTPNKVDVDLAADGRVSFYNLAGTVNVAADVTGYYVDHDHDDRYYTKAQVDTALATKAPKSPGALVVGADEFQLGLGQATSVVRIPGRYVTASASACYSADADLPHGATVTRVVWYGNDTTLSDSLDTAMSRNPIGGDVVTLMADVDSTGALGDVTLIDSTIANALVDRTTASYLLTVCLDANVKFFDVVIEFTGP